MLPRCVASHGGERRGTTRRPCPIGERSGGPIPRRVGHLGQANGRRGDGRAGRVRCRGPRSTRPGRRRSDREGSCALSRSGLSPRIQIAAGPPAGLASTSTRSRLHSSARRNPRSNKHARISLSLRARESVPAPIAAHQSNRTSSKSGPLIGVDVETPIRSADLT